MIPNGTTGLGGSLALTAGGLVHDLSAFTAGVASIRPQSSLPIVTSPLVVDAHSTRLDHGTAVVELDGNSAGSNSTGVALNAPNIRWAGFLVSRWSAHGVLVYAAATSTNPAGQAGSV